MRDRLTLGAASRRSPRIGVFDATARRGRRDVVRAPGRSAAVGPAPTCGSATRSARRRVGAAEHFAPPTLETVVVPRRAGRPRPAARRAHPARRAGPADRPAAGRRPQELSVSLYGEVQKEVIGATLADDYGIDGGLPRRPPRSASSGRPAPARRVELIGEGPTRSSPRSGCGVEPAPLGGGRRVRARGRARLDAAARSSGGRGDRAGRRWRRACAAGRWRTAWSR